MASSRSRRRRRRRRRRRALKRKNNKRRGLNHAPSPLSAIQLLPRDLLLDVVATVASHSFLDIHSMKILCKDFLQVAEDSYVLKKMSLDNLPLIPWLHNEKVSSFLRRCLESENIEVMFRQGLLEYFGYPNGNIGGLERLKTAAEKGHKEALYVSGMILLCSENQESRKEGLEHMRFLRESKCVVSSRKKVEYLTKSLWKNNGMLMRNQTPICNSNDMCKGWRVKKGRWLLLDDEDDDMGLCEDCRWDHELEFFYQLFNVH